MKRIHYFLLCAAALFVCAKAGAVKFTGISVADKNCLILGFLDGEVRYRDNGTGSSAYLGHTFVEGDDTLVTFHPRLDGILVSNPELWTISSTDDKTYGTGQARAVWRKSKPMQVDHNLDMELEHTLYLELPKSMKQGCTYTVSFPAGLGADITSASIEFDVWTSRSEAIHVNIIGYQPREAVKTADLYLWMGDGGQRDFKSFEGHRIWLYNADKGDRVKSGTVKFWKSRTASEFEAGGRDLTASDVWSLDFVTAASCRPGRYRLVVEGIGCSSDFEIGNETYFQPYRYSVRGYYYMRLGEPSDSASVWPVPRQPRFIPGVDPADFTVYKTDLHPWHPDWRKMRGDVWDEPHFKPASESFFWQHRLPGNPVNVDVKGGHSDAYDWDRHLSHVVNIYDLLLPYILTEGRLSEDNLGIRESGNGIPDIIDEARNEVDFFLSIRDGEGYSQGVTNPSREWTVMFQAGCTTMAAWANAANCAMLASALKIAGRDDLAMYYASEAVTAYDYASRQENLQLDDRQDVMTGRDFRLTAAAYLYNVTGDTRWEDALAAESSISGPDLAISGTGGRIWATAAYLCCPWERHYTQLYNNMTAVIDSLADNAFLGPMKMRPSRRAAIDPRHRTSENLQAVMLAHHMAQTAARRTELEHCMYSEAGWGLGRNPSNIIEMTGLGERHFENIYSTGHNDGDPGTHPGQTPFLGTEVWSSGDGGDATLLTERCYPLWEDWPQQDSYFNQRYLWVNAEFTPRETMRGKTALLAYIYGIRDNGQPAE